MLDKLLEWVMSRVKTFDIKKEVGGETKVYLRRGLLCRTPFFNVFLHRIYLPDTDPDPHDHPWSFLNVVIAGGYVEHLYACGGDSPLTGSIAKHRMGFSVFWRPISTVHKITYVEPGTWTLLITGPRQQEWGFYPVGSSGSRQWVHWRKYLDTWERHLEMD